ncbi:uncharacterized protein VTP21DRAFT_6532 [Calcarisporiella thermophila]|uniref:uncharacterized protein n=1 Tax=Calcarisporiella thermophila TaxID=911321 RepID=UPI0037426F7D
MPSTNPSIPVPTSSDSSNNVTRHAPHESISSYTLPAYLQNTMYAALQPTSSTAVESTHSITKEGGGDCEWRLPTAWNPKEKCQLLDLSRDCLRVSYKGCGKEDQDAAAVRANYSMPSQCGLFYYEVEILSKGRDGYIGIGFCTGNVKLDRLPGWEPNSWGYHGDDGCSFNSSGQGRKYGPCFTTGDIIGCGVNFMDNTAFYTKNGVHLGIAFKNLSNSPLFPSVGLRTPGELVEANFGQRAFRFDILNFYNEERKRLWRTINAFPYPYLSASPSTPAAPTSGGSSEGEKDRNRGDSDEKLMTTLNELVVSYLVHRGYTETVHAFSRHVPSTMTLDTSKTKKLNGSNATGDVEMLPVGKHDKSWLEDEEDMHHRQQIWNSIVHKGDIDAAIELALQHYPSVFSQDNLILFRLRRQKFIEMMRAYSASRHGMDLEEEESGREQDGAAADLLEEDVEGIRNGMEETQSGDDAMEVDEGGRVMKRNLAFRGLVGGIRNVMQYGQRLQDMYADDPRPEVRDGLIEAFGLLAYTDPFQSPMAYLLARTEREPVANALNCAILVSRGAPATTPLERCFRHASSVARELVRIGHGSAAFLNVEKDCLV